jgi:hypothetical protein
MEDFRIAGGSNDEKESAKKKIDGWRDEGLQPRYGEGEKNLQDVRLINIANELLSDLSKQLGFEFQPIPLERIHITPAGAGEKVGQYDSGRHDISIGEISAQQRAQETGTDYDLLMLALLLHEVVHLAGHQKYQITDKGQVGSYRIGYETYSRNGVEPKLEGFNEAVVDAITMTLLRRNAGKLQQEIGADFSKVRDDVLFNYEYHTRMLGMIIRKISEVKNEKVEEVRDRIFKGYFTGEMMHLRDVVDAYGESALKVLAKWGDNHGDIEIQNQVARYLKEPSIDKREKIAQKLLSSSTEN